MNKRERVKNAMDGLPVDHVPVAFWFHFKGDEAVGEGNIAAHLKYYRETDLDFVKIMCDGFFNYPCDTEVLEAADFRKVPVLSKDHPYIADQVYRAKKIVEAIGEERMVFYNVFAPFSAIRFEFGDDFVMEALKEDPEAVLTALDRIAETQSVLSELLIEEAGIDGIYFPVQGGEWDRFTEEEYKKLIAPSELKVLSRANRVSDYNIMHCCGFAGAKNNLSLWADYPVKCVNWAVHVEEFPLADGRELFGHKACLGGFKTLWDEKHREGIIYHGTKEELQAYTKGIIDTFGKKGLLLGGDCTVDAAIPWEQIKWVVEAARLV